MQHVFNADIGKTSAVTPCSRILPNAALFVGRRFPAVSANAGGTGVSSRLKKNSSQHLCPSPLLQEAAGTNFCQLLWFDCFWRAIFLFSTMYIFVSMGLCDCLSVS